MSPKEKTNMQIFDDAIDAANKIGPRTIEETRGDIQVTTTASAFIYAGFCTQAGISLHDSIDLLMSSYKYLTEEDGVSK